MFKGKEDEGNNFFRVNVEKLMVAGKAPRNRILGAGSCDCSRDVLSFKTVANCCVQNSCESLA